MEEWRGRSQEKETRNRVCPQLCPEGGGAGNGDTGDKAEVGWQDNAEGEKHVCLGLFFGLNIDAINGDGRRDRVVGGERNELSFEYVNLVWTLNRTGTRGKGPEWKWNSLRHMYVYIL